MEVCVFSLLLIVLCVELYGKSASTEVCPVPVVTPASLLVEYGSPAEVICSIPHKPVTDYRLGWEAKTSPKQISNETSLVWKVESLTQWEEVEGLQCYFTGSEDCQKTTVVNLTIYKSPDKVTLIPVPLWVEGNQTELKCEIKNVGPGHKLNVFWSRAEPKNNNTFIPFNETLFPELLNEIKNVTKTVSITITPSREDEGVQYQCAAVLNLGHRLIINSSQILSTVHYKPDKRQAVEVQSVTGESLVINCSTEGNPRPQYNWRLPNNTFISNSSSIIIISSVHEEDQGQYTCIASNYLGQETWTMTVTVIPDYTIYIIIGAVIIIIVVFIIMWWMHYQNTHMGHYILTKGHVDHKAEDQKQL